MRLLANIETSTVKLLNLVLVGQPELADRLNEQSLRQLKQRITLRAQLTPLDLQRDGGLRRRPPAHRRRQRQRDLHQGRGHRHPRDLDRAAAHHQRPLRQRADGRLRARRRKPVDAAHRPRGRPATSTSAGRGRLPAHGPGMAWVTWQSRPARSGPAPRGPTRRCHAARRRPADGSPARARKRGRPGARPARPAPQEAVPVLLRTKFR